MCDTRSGASGAGSGSDSGSGSGSGSSGGSADERSQQARQTLEHVLVTVTERCTVLLFHFAISGQSGSGPRWGFIEVETTVGLPAAQSRPRMRAVPGADPFFVSRRSCGYQKPKRAILLCLSARHKRNKRHRTRKRKSHREIKRAPRGKWPGRRVRNGVNFGARCFFGHVASSEARVGVR